MPSIPRCEVPPHAPGLSTAIRQRRSYAARKAATELHVVRRVCQVTNETDGKLVLWVPKYGNPVPGLIMMHHITMALGSVSGDRVVFLELARRYKELTPGDVGVNVHRVGDGIFVPVGYTLCAPCMHVMQTTCVKRHYKTGKHLRNVQHRPPTAVTYPKRGNYHGGGRKCKIRHEPKRCKTCGVIGLSYSLMASGEVLCSPCATVQSAQCREYIRDAYDRRIALKMCQLCHSVDNLCIHHDHTKRPATVANILCRRCNHLIGQFKDDPKAFYAAAIAFYFLVPGDFGANKHCAVDPPYTGLSTKGLASPVDAIRAMFLR